MGFVDESYLLESETARELYAAIADLPIVDVHTHVDPEAVLADQGWANPWAVLGETDHYVWTLMRNRGIEEAQITGDADPREKWDALAAVLPECIGSPTYEWLHLDLARRFGVERPLRPETADEIWATVADRLESGNVTQRTVLEEMGVEVLCTTDRPTTSLDVHDALANELDGTRVLPTWRADRAVRIHAAGWPEFVEGLEAATGVDTSSFQGYLAAIARTRDRFADRGCLASDIGIERPVSRPVDQRRAERIYERRLSGASIDADERMDFLAFMLEHIATRDATDDWVTQLHVGPVRSYRRWLRENVSGGAGNAVASSQIDLVGGCQHLLDVTDPSATVVLYCVDPAHYAEVATIARAYENVSVGPPWWWNDSPLGMDRQLEFVGTVDALANHAGMVSDSRKLPSLGSRFEMFRRVLANLLGRGVERGQYPEREARELATYLAYDRPKALFDV